MIQLQSISLQRGSKQLLTHADLTIQQGQKIGLIGANGTGKSTLFQLLLGELQTDAGHCQVPPQWRIGHMQQELHDTGRSAIEFVLDGDPVLREVQAKIEQLSAAEAAANDADTQKQLANLYTQLEDCDGYSAESRAAQLLSGLGFAQEQMSLAVAQFSGGWRVRLALAQALMCPSDLLLLDEPTNHLDLNATLWLEQWLRTYSGTLLIISHDRDVLDNIIDTIVHIENHQLFSYRGNYSNFEVQRADKLAQQQQLFKKQQTRIAEIQGFVARFRAKATKARQAQSRLKELQRMELIAPAHVDSPFDFHIPCPEKIPQTLLTLADAGVGYEQTECVAGVNLSIYDHSRIGLLGFNGAGKSTLLKSLANELQLLRGQRHAHEELHIGYFAQHQVESLDLHASPALHLQRERTDASEQQVRNFLGGFGFIGDRAFESVRHFSGGEKARLTLAIIAWQQPNLLLLDEPTNHLDMDMRYALTDALQGYAGAIVLISHDRHLLRNTVDEFLLVDQGKVEDFDGDLEDYQRWLAKAPQTTAQTSRASAALASSGQFVDRKAQRQQAAQQRRALKPLTDRIRRLEKEMAKLQRDLDAVSATLADTSLYQAEDKEELQALLRQQGNLKQSLATAEESWLTTQEDLENLRAESSADDT